MTEKQIYYFLAVKEIIELFAEQELGSRCEINIPNTLAYIKSAKFSNDTWGLNTKDEIYQLVTDDILSGYPVWQLLNVSEWTRDMLERELTHRQEEARRELERTYKCYTCTYFDEINTSLGIVMKCNRPLDTRQYRWRPYRGNPFEPKKRCKYYQRRECDE